MTSPARVFAILNLFDEAHPVWHTDDINAALGYARATGYRYVRDLVEAGFLAKIAAGRYSLGPRIIELDYQLRRGDPVLLAAVPVMDDLIRDSGLDAVLSTVFGARAVDIHRASADPALELSYGRGRPRPLYRGAAPKVILANLARARLLRLYEATAVDAAAGGLGDSWEAFRSRLAEIRRADFYWSRGELEAGVSGAAVPLFDSDGDVVASLALVGQDEAVAAVGEDRLRRLLEAARNRIHDRLASEVGPAT